MYARFKYIGIIGSGYVLSAVITQIITIIIVNPENLEPIMDSPENNRIESYYPIEVSENLPILYFIMIVYAILILWLIELIIVDKKSVKVGKLIKKIVAMKWDEISDISHKNSYSYEVSSIKYHDLLSMDTWKDTHGPHHKILDNKLSLEMNLLNKDNADSINDCSKCNNFFLFVLANLPFFLFSSKFSNNIFSPFFRGLL